MPKLPLSRKEVKAAADRAEKHAGGRPTKYSPAYCTEVIQAGDEGLSLTAFAGMIGVCRATIGNWMEEHPEFLAAVKVHAAKRTLHLERGLLSLDVGPMITARIFALKNAAPDEWRDKQHHELTGKDGGAIQTESKMDLSALDADERIALRAMMEKAVKKGEG